jgi:hypothetical protein
MPSPLALLSAAASSMPAISGPMERPDRAVRRQEVRITEFVA